MVEMEINFEQDTNIVANKPSLENAEVSSSSGCFGWAASFYCGTP